MCNSWEAMHLECVIVLKQFCAAYEIIVCAKTLTLINWHREILNKKKKTHRRTTKKPHVTL